MRRTLTKTLVAVAVVTVSAFGADSSIGTWKLNLDKSKYNPPPIPVKSLTSTREASKGGVKVMSTGERADGTPIKASYTTKYDGTPSSVTGSGAPYDTISIKRVDANTFTDERKNTGGSYHAKGSTVISDGGKVMTWTSEGTDPDGKPFTAVFVYEKQ
jgi:hypothetical protein